MNSLPFPLRNGYFLFLLGVITTICLFAKILKWNDVVSVDENGKLQLTDERKQAVSDRHDRLDNAELYMLIAEVDGYFECPSCPLGTHKRGKYFLKAGEVYKYGVTIQKKDRYTESELNRWRLTYVDLDRGSDTAMKKKETTLIAEYALHPENLKRSEKWRLAIPPGSGTDLR